MTPGTPELAVLFELLRSARLKAGLSQAQVAEALGMRPPFGKSYVSHLERGRVRNPSLRVVVDFLRACKAGPCEIGEAFGRWLAVPLPVPESKAGPRTRARQRKEDVANLELRQQAVWYASAQVLEYMLHRELSGLGVPTDHVLRPAILRLGRRTFRILYETRAGEPKNRARRLGRVRAWARKRALPGELVEHLSAKVAGLFTDMEREGDLDWLPSIEDAKHTMALSPRRRVLTDEQMCRRERLEQQAKEHAAFMQKLGPIMEQAKKLLKLSGLSDQKAGYYLGFVNGFVNVARTTRPGSEERRRKIESMLEAVLRKWHDRALVDRLGQLVMSEWDTPG